jgi:hypothetical protein
MQIVRNEKGIALITALMFTLISLGIIMTLLYLITQGTKMSAANKTYKSSLEASYGAAEIVTKDVLPLVFKNCTTAACVTQKVGSFGGIDPTAPNAACTNRKATLNTAHWADAPACVANSKTEQASVLPDMTFNLKAENDPTGFKVYTKIVDTRCGGDPAIGQKCTNSDSGGVEGLDSGSGVAGIGSAITVERKPAYYRVEIQGERASNPKEKTKLSILYAY